MKEYSYSYDEEGYHGPFPSAMAAAAEAFGEDPDASIVWIGENVPPPAPESFLYADLLIEHVQVQDDYDAEWAESWPRATNEHRAELTQAVRKVFADWLDRHGLRPRFWTVENVTRISRDEMELHFAQKATA